MKTPAAGRSAAPTTPIPPSAAEPRPEARLRTALAARLGEDRYHRWFGDAEIRIDERGVEVRTSGAFAKRMLDHALSRELREVA